MRLFKTIKKTSMKNDTYNTNTLRRLLLQSLLVATSVALVSCGGKTTQFNDDDLPSPVVEEIDGDGNPVDSETGADPVSEEELETLPNVFAGNNQFADPNVLISLRGSAEARGDASIANILWTQVEGPDVLIPNPNDFESQLVIPDFEEETQLLFRLTVQDTEGRVNSSTTAVVVTPTSVIARVIGDVVTEGADSVSFKIRLSSPQENDVSVNYTTIDGSAEAGIDYEATADTIVIPAGETEATVDVTIFSGNIDSDNESFILQITVLSDDQTYSSNAGVVLIRDNPVIQPAPPEPPILVDEPAQTYTQGTAVLLVFGNQGGGSLSSCIVVDSTLPAGLSLATDEGASTCVVSGTPAEASEPTDYVIEATNADGSDTTSVTIAVEALLLPPSIEDIAEPITYTQNLAITPLALTNTGGGQLTECGDSELLPAGLTVSISEDASTCVISGTPTAIEANPSPIAITASNTAGSDSGSVSITVVPDLVAPVLNDLDPATFTVGEAITPLSFPNTGGGELSDCFEDTEEPILAALGLSLSTSESADTCVISGTPTSTLQTTIVSVTGANAVGNSVANISLTVEPALDAPALADLESQTYTEGVQIQTLTFVNTGGGELTTCTENSAEPILETIGLNVTVSDNQSTCEIIGTPTSAISASDIEITATNASGDSTANVIITIEAALAAPSLEDAEAQVFSVGSAITTVSFVNNGGGELSSCEESGEALLLTGVGLDVAISDDATTCDISGTPTAALSTADIAITATNATGNSSGTISITIEPALVAPVITSPAPQSYLRGTAITPVVFTNTGGGELSSCREDSAEPILAISGLNLNVSDDLSTCELTGTPTLLITGDDIDVIATNAAGSATTTINITVEEPLAAPILEDLEPLSYVEGSPIPTLIIDNAGGGELTACDDVEELLPVGLVVSRSEDFNTCEISGTPIAPQETTTVIIQATNATGSDTTNVSITISLAPPELILPSPAPFIEGQEIATLVIENTGGGELETCVDENETLPIGLELAVSLDGNNCEIDGTPIEPQVLTDVVVSATNASGTSTITFSMEVFIAVPDLSDLTAQTFTVGTTIDPVSFANDGGGSLFSCAAVTTLPDGLAVQRSSDLTTCELSGTPTEPTETAEYTIRATNASGSSEALVEITTEIVFVPEDLDIPIGETSSVTIELAIASGTATVNWNDGSEPEVVTNQSVAAVENSSSTQLTHAFEDILPTNITITFSDELSSVLAIESSSSGFAFDIALLSDLPNVEYIRFGGGIIDGQLSSLTDLANLRHLSIGGEGDFSGSLGEIPPALEILSLSNAGVEGISLFGDLTEFPSNLEILSVSNTDITGDLSDLAANNDVITTFSVQNNTITGDIADLPASLELFQLRGLNTITGDIGSFGENLTSIVIEGQNTLFGDIGNMPAFSANSNFTIYGQNTITGDIANIPSVINTFQVFGSNTLFGNIEDVHSALTTLDVRGLNTISGDLGLVPVGSFSFRIWGENTIDEFNINPTWTPLGPVGLDLRNGGESGFTSDEIDRLLIFLSDQVTEATATRNSITISRTADESRTFASDTAVATLDELGYSVFIDRVLAAQEIAFENTEDIVAFPEETFSRQIADTGLGTGAITYTSSDPELIFVDPDTGDVSVSGSGSAVITATKAADDEYASASASYEVFSIIGGEQLIPSTDLVASPTQFTIDQINDGVVSDAFPWNGFSATPDTGTITFNFSSEEEVYDIDAFLLWNDVNIASEGVRSFRLDFYNIFGQQISPGFSTEFTAVSQEEAQRYDFPETIANVTRIDLVVLDSNGGVEIREVGFLGEPGFGIIDGAQ